MNSKLSKFSRIAVQNLFYSKITALEESELKGVGSKIMLIDEAETELQMFMEKQPRSKFHILSEDENGEIMELVVMNCPEEVVRNEFEIKIDPYWVGWEAQQYSIDKQDKLIVKIHAS